MTHMLTQQDTAAGNTKTAAVNDKTRARGWCMTINNWTPEEKSLLMSYLEDKRYVVGEELGKRDTLGTPHLQIYFYCKNAITFGSLKKKFPRAHIEVAKGSPEQNVKYCSKEARNVLTNIYVEMPTIPERDTMRGWQNTIIEELNGTPDGRKINWIYDPDGNNGKSYLAKYLAYNNKVVWIRGGKATDIKNVLMSEKQARDIIIDVPRCTEGHISYTVIEELLDGYIFSVKYEGGIKWITTPFVYVFSNDTPEIDKMSHDRWVIRRIKDGELVDVDMKYC